MVKPDKKKLRSRRRKKPPQIAEPKLEISPERPLPSPSILLISLTIAVLLIVFVSHWPALSAESISFDDHQYVLRNQLVQNPGWTSAKRFLTEVLEPSTIQGYYQPLAMISLMLDYAMGGRPDNLMPFHRTSLSLHVINTGLIIIFLYMLFGKVWPAVLTGLIFGIHPLTVEPVTWLAERKTLLASFFALWCLIIYVRYTHKNNWKLYCGCALAYILAVMSKPITTPLPILLLLLDFWPLNRSAKRAFAEKIPLMLIMLASAIITIVSQGRTASVTMPSDTSFLHIPLILCHNIIFYLYKMVWPINVSAHYLFPQPMAISNMMVLLGLVGTCILLPILLISLRWTRALLTGWLFFFIAVFPTMGVIGFTIVIASDRYAYLPSVGILMVLAWFMGWLWKRFCGALYARIIIIVLLAVILFSEFVLTRRCLVHWQGRDSIYEYMLKIDPDSYDVHNNYGSILLERWQLEESIKHFKETLRVIPNDLEALRNIGKAYLAQGKIDESIVYFKKVLNIKNDLPMLYNDLGQAYSLQGKHELAIQNFNKSLRLQPNYTDAINDLAVTLKQMDRIDEAVENWKKVIQLEPGHPNAHYNMALVMAQRKKYDEAVKHFKEALRTKPDWPSAHYNMGIIYHYQGKLDLTIKQCRKALEFNPDYILARTKLAATLMELNEYKAAIEEYYKVLQSRPDQIGVLNNVAYILATTEDTQLRNPNDAVKFAQKACVLTKYNSPEILDTLAIAYAAAGRFSEAVKTAEKAIKLAVATDKNDLAEKISTKLKSYKTNQPYRTK